VNGSTVPDQTPVAALASAAHHVSAVIPATVVGDMGSGLSFGGDPGSTVGSGFGTRRRAVPFARPDGIVYGAPGQSYVFGPGRLPMGAPRLSGAGLATGGGFPDQFLGSDEPTRSYVCNYPLAI
jgi:hypothetical protein